MSTSASSEKTSRRRRWLVIGMVAGLLAIVAVAGGWHLLNRDGELSLVPPGRAASLLAQVEQAAELPVRTRGLVERGGPDGPMPEIAGRLLVVDAGAPMVRARVLAACRSLGLAQADDMRRAIEPEALCDGGEGHGGESVHLRLTCQGTCTAYLQTQIVGF